MTKVSLGLLVAVCLCGGNLMAQGISSAEVSSSAVLCSQSGNPSASCAATWAEGVYQGGGGGAASDAYGVLRFAASALLSCNSACAQGQTGSGASAQFSDSFTFVGVPNTGAYLQVTVTMLGSIGGGFIEPSQADVSSTAVLTGPTQQATCSNIVNTFNPIGSVRKVCRTRLPISPTDTVNVEGNGGISQVAALYSSLTDANQAVQSDFATIGTVYGYQITDTNGKRLPYAVIIAASGHTYPYY